MWASIASGLFSGRDTNSAQIRYSEGSQRVAINASSARSSVTMTWASELITATLVPGCSCKKCEASTCGVRTKSIWRGSITMSFAPSRRRFFMRDANTGWASVGFAPISKMTSEYSTDLKSWVPAEVPKALLKPKPVGEWHTRAHVSTLLFPNAARTIFCTTNTSSLVQREELIAPIESKPCLA